LRAQRRSKRFSADAVRAEAAAVEASDEARDLFLRLALADQLDEFLTLPAYNLLV